MFASIFPAQPFATSLVVLLLGWNLCLAAQDAKAEKTSFIKDATAAWEAYQLRAKRLQGSVVYTASNIHDAHDSKKRTTTVNTHRQIEFKQRPDCALWQVQSLVEGAKPNGIGTLEAMNPYYRFELGRSTSDSPWLVTGVVVKNKETGASANDTSGGPALWCNLPLTPFSDEHKLPILVNSRTFHVKQIVPIARDGRTFTKVVFTDQSTKFSLKHMIIMTSGWVLLDPDHYWVIHEFDVRFMRWQGEGKSPLVGNATGKYEYQTGNDPFPLVTQFKRVLDYPSQLLSVSEEFKFAVFESDVPESAFRLSNFGFPEPMGVPAPPRSQTYLWFALAAAAAILTAILLWQWGKRRYSRSPSPAGGTGK